MAEPRPADECPFARPLPDGFDACATFHPVQFVPITAMFQPLRPVLTCRHMEVGVRDNGPGTAYYCRCAVGDAAARATLAAETDRDRARLMRELADGIMTVVLEHWEELGTVKGREMAALAPVERIVAKREVAEVAARIDLEMRQLALGRLRGHLDQLGIEPSAMLAVIDAGVRDFEAHGFANWSPPAHLLAKLPADVAAFLRPDGASAVSEEQARPA